MIRRLVRVGFRLGVMAALGYVVARLVGQRRNGADSPVAAPTWPPVTPPRADPTGGPVIPAEEDVPTVPSVAASAEPIPPQAWVEAIDDACPETHPVKAKLSSKIFHLPGMFAYDRTKPDRCYRDGAAAEADGFRKAKR